MTRLRPLLGKRGLLSAAAALASAALASADTLLPPTVRPTPQKASCTRGGVNVRGWAVGASKSAASGLAASMLLNLTGAGRALPVSTLPKARFVAVGVPSEDSALRALATAHGVAAPAGQAEGYAVVVSDDAVIVVANTAAGAFFGAQTVVQMAAAGQAEAAATVPKCDIEDWPDFPIRGAYMFGGPRLEPPATAPLQWHKDLVDWMSAHKMNLGVVVASFYDVVPSLASNATAAAALRAQLAELRRYMENRFVEFVPTLASGSGGGPERFNPATAEGKWVRNGSFEFGDDDVLKPRGGTEINATEFNGDFARLSPSKPPDSRQVPTRWSFHSGTAPSDPQQWAVVDGDAPWASKSGRSLKCTMKAESCSAMPPDGACESEVATSPRINVTGGSVLQMTVWAKLTSHSGQWSEGFGPQITVVPIDSLGHSQLSASIKLSPSTSPDSAKWQQYTVGITTFPNTSQVYLYSRLQGAKATATWSIADLSIVQLDNSLRNVIRTNTTDFEVWNTAHTVQYELGKDFEVANPTRADNADRCNLTELDPYVVRRVSSGKISAGEEVLVSFDFLPGKVDVQGHSTPNAFAEPEYYALMDTAISEMAQSFPGISFVNFNHDEIRGMARDSRSLRSGLSNAELLAKDMNALQSSVTKHLGDGSRALFWDDMVNPDHNGGNENYQQSEGGGRPGKTDLALLSELVSKDVLWFSWAYGVSPPVPNSTAFSDLRKIDDAPNLFASHGYDWVGSPWSDPANVRAWGESLRKARQQGHWTFARGLVDTEWGDLLPPTQWGNIPNVSAAAWNLDAFLGGAAL